MKQKLWSECYGEIYLVSKPHHKQPSTNLQYPNETWVSIKNHFEYSIYASLIYDAWHFNNSLANHDDCSLGVEIFKSFDIFLRCPLAPGPFSKDKSMITLCGMKNHLIT